MAKIEKTRTSIRDARMSAGKQADARVKASDKRKAAAGIKSDPSKIMIKKDVSGKTTATKYGQSFEGPISGSAVARARRRNAARNVESGVMQGGKIIKGGATARKLAENYKNKKGK